MFEELRAREAIRRNLVVYGLEEPDQSIKEGKDRMEADKSECENIFNTIGSKARRTDIRFCLRLGERGEDARPLLLGMTSETVKCEVLDRAKELQNTEYQHIGMTGPGKKAETGGNQADRGSEPNEQRRIDGTGQGKKLEVGRNRPERIKKISEDAGQGERRNARRPVGQGGQRERTRDLDTGEGEESEAGRGNEGGQREASEDQNKTVTVLYTNAQSIGSKIDELKAITQELEPDIILLTETWCNNSVGNAALSLENYKLETELRKDRCDTANGVGGGLLVYS
jgi:hypothetical protein